MLRSTAVVLTGLVGVARSHNSLMIPTSRNAMDGPAMPDGGASSPWTLDGIIITRGALAI